MRKDEAIYMIINGVYTDEFKHVSDVVDKIYKHFRKRERKLMSKIREMEKND